MFTFKRGKRNPGGGQYTFISIVLIVIAVYVFRLVAPQSEAAYPDTIQYSGVRYEYTETVRSWPLMFVRKRPVSEAGYIVLARRGVDAWKELYVYEGHMKYRRYVMLKE